MSNTPFFPLMRHLRASLGKIPRALLFLSLLLATQSARPARAIGATLYVAPGGATSHSCDVWANACELQYALGSVAVSGDELWVQQGTYVPGAARSDTFTLLSGVGIYGGFVGSETLLEERDPAANVTVLSGEIGAGDIGDNSYHVTTGGGTDGTAVLDGFTVTAGTANGVSPDDSGGGMYNSASSPTLNSVIFSLNSAKYGGGMYNNASSPTLTDVIFSGNFGSNPSYNYGGGMYNTASSPILTDVAFIGNHTIPGRAGGMYNVNGGSAALTNVTFNGNSTADNGGGMANFESSASLINVTFSGNSSLDSGGGLSNYQSFSTLTNVTFSGNSAPSGGAIQNHTSSPTLTNTIIANSPSGGDCVNDFAGSVNVLSANNLIEDAASACGLTNGVNGNIIGQDPNLGALANNGGLTQTMALGAGSPAINTGNDGSCPADDQRGMIRPQAVHCDIGAFEAELSPISVADLDGDGDTDVSVFRDGTWFVRNQGATGWGQVADIPIATDYDGDGDSDFAIYRPSTGGWRVKDQFVVAHGGLAGDVPVPGDYDFDGDSDVAIYRSSTAGWYIKDQFTVGYGLSTDIPVPGDYNGDGITDIAVFRDGVWYVRNQGVTGWGQVGDIPIPGDYDGDGDTDFAIYRPSTGGWRVKDQFVVAHGGLPGDIPVPGDYDNDGDTDVAIYRSSTAGWYIKDQFTVGYGLSTDYPVPARDTNGDGDPYQ